MADDRPAYFASMTNGANNALVLYDTNGKLVATLPTGGNGGASGNGGAVQSQDGIIAIADFGSRDVAIFFRGIFGDIDRRQLLKTASPPVSLAFGHQHLYVLELDRVESFHVGTSYGFYTGSGFDGSAPLTKADNTAGQIGYLSDGHVIYTEKSGGISQIALLANGAVTGFSTMVTGLPASLNTPLGLSTRDNVALVTSAHDAIQQQLLIIGGKVVAMANGTGVFSSDADCWNAFFGLFAYSADSPGKKLDRYVATNVHLLFDKVAATLPGAPTDLAVSSGGYLGVIWGSGLSIFHADSEGELTLMGSSPAGALNGAAWVE